MYNIRLVFPLLLLLISIVFSSGCTRSSLETPGEETPMLAVYIDPSVSVSGDGSQASPYKTWAEVTFQPGYSYLQKRGTVARESIIVNASGTASAPILLGAYGTGTAPVIQGSQVETGWVSTGVGFIYQKIISLSAGQDLGMAAEDGTVLTWHEWNTDVAATFAGASAGSYSFDPGTKTVYVWCTDGASPDAHVMEVSRRLFGVRGTGVSHVRVENFHVRYASLHGIAFEDGTYISISGCIVEKLGGAVIAPGPLYAGNGIEFGNSSSHCSVANCVISDIFDSGVSPQTYASNHSASDFLFSNLTISRCGFAGVEIAALHNGGMTNCDISNVVVRNVTVSDCGKGWSGRRYGVEGRGIKINADLVPAPGDNTRSISGVIVEDCIVSGSAGEGIFVGGNAGTVTVRRCTVRDNEESGVLAQEGESTTLLLDIYSSIIRDNGIPTNSHGIAYNVLYGQGLRVRQCTFYNNEFIGLNIWSHDGEALIVNNVFHAPAYKVHLLVNDDIFATAVMENNCFTEFGAGNPIFNYIGTTYDLVADFDFAYAFASGDIGAGDPLLNADLTLQGPASPCYHAGSTAAGIAADRYGNAFANPPSIGAFEYY